MSNFNCKNTSEFHLTTILRLTSFYGLFPFRYNNGSFKVDVYLAIYSVFFIFVFLVSGFIIIFSCLTEWTSGPRLPLELQAFEITLQATLLVCNLSFTLWNQKKINCVLKLMNKVDKSCSLFGFGSEDTCFSLGEVLEVTLPYILFVTNTSGTMQAVLPFFIQLYRLMANVAVLAVTAQFTRFLCRLHCQFCILFRALAMFERNRSEFSRAGAVNLLAVAYNQVCEASNELGDAYAPQVLVVVIYSFSSIVMHSYSVVAEIKEPHISFQNLIPKANLVLLTSFVTWRIASSAVKLREKAKEFNNVLYRIMITDDTAEIINNGKLSLHIAMKREVAFTACGFFSLDYTLAHSVVASATKYLVLFIQYDQPSQPPVDYSNLTSEAVNVTSTYPTTPSQ